MRRVLVTHVDTALGRRLAKALYHDPDVGLVLGVGTGPPPSFLGAYAEKIAYQRLDLARARHVINFFASELFARAALDSVIHLPFVSEREGERIPGRVHSLVSETRRLIESCKRERRIASFVYLSSAFVYPAAPGNVNVVSEDDLLDFENEGDAEVRAWVDADLVCQKELNDTRLRTTILRAATIVCEGGRFLLSPPLERKEAALGFDPMIPLVSDRDVARALVLALHADRPGIYNVAGPDAFPRSQLTDAGSGLTAAIGWIGQLAGIGSRRESGVHRYGIMLDTRLAADQLGFEPQYKVEVRGSGSSRRVDVVRCR